MSAEQIGGFLPIILVFVFFYFFIIRPQNKQQKKIREMRSSLQKGDRIITIGGFHGKIIGFKEDIITIELKPDNVKAEITKSAVAEVLHKADVDPKKTEENKEN